MRSGISKTPGVAVEERTGGPVDVRVVRAGYALECRRRPVPRFSARLLLLDTAVGQVATIQAPANQNAWMHQPIGWDGSPAQASQRPQAAVVMDRHVGEIVSTPHCWAYIVASIANSPTTPSTIHFRATVASR